MYKLLAQRTFSLWGLVFLDGCSLLSMCSQSFSINHSFSFSQLNTNHRFSDTNNSTDPEFNKKLQQSSKAKKKLS